MKFAVRIFCIAIIAASTGIVLGQGYAKAETTGPNYVDWYGNILFAITTGGPMSPGSYGTGKSTTTMSIYYLKAHARAWHLQAIDEQDSKSCGSCQNIATIQISSGTYDAFVVTQSHARGVGSGGNYYYTSVYPHGARSCYRYWNSGQSC